MDCDALQQELPDLLYGELDEALRSACAEHTAGCPACAQLLAELQAVRAVEPRPVPPPLLGWRVKLAARDALLNGDPDALPQDRRGLFLPLLTAGLLATLLALTAFALGVAVGRRAARRGSPPALPLPEVPDADAVRPAEPGPGEPRELGAEADGLPRPPRRALDVPQASVAWQRVLLDAARARLAKGELRAAREFFVHAARIAPRGPLAAAARLGAAEAALRAGRSQTAAHELQALRKELLAGLLSGDAALLQRLDELLDEAAPSSPR